MKRAYQIRIMTWLVIMIASFGSVTAASAGVWAWGCQGQLGDQQVIFNRYSLFVVDGKKKLGDLKKLINDKIDKKIVGDGLNYEPQNGNDGFIAAIEFLYANDPDRKIVLTEISSRKTSGKARQICGRDETTDIFRKVYRYERESESARDITMQCIEYQLSTRGGRTDPC